LRQSSAFGAPMLSRTDGQGQPGVGIKVLEPRDGVEASYAAAVQRTSRRERTLAV
jgi:hypothetical protein